jgi:hypothetical protein
VGNGEQIERNIERAKARVAEWGYFHPKEVTDRDVMLTGSAYVADRIDKRFDRLAEEFNTHTIHLRFSKMGGKQIAGVVLTVVTVVVGAIWGIQVQ